MQLVQQPSNFLLPMKKAGFKGRALVGDTLSIARVMVVMLFNTDIAGIAEDMVISSFNPLSHVLLLANGILALRKILLAAAVKSIVRDMRHFPFQAALPLYIFPDQD
jgi:hypothetical protein